MKAVSALRRAQRGFTILELLAVLVIIGIIVSFAALSVGDGGRADQVEQEARRLGALMELAGEEAVLQSRSIGLMLRPHGYTFVVPGDQAWIPLAGDGLLRERKLAPDIDVVLMLDGLKVALDGGGDEIKPQLLFYSSGERTPFEILVGPEIDGPRYKLTGPPLGKFTLEGPLQGY